MKIILEQKLDKKTNKKEWVLTNDNKILKSFGSKKPSKKKLQIEEEKIQYFSNVTENIITEMHNVSGELRNKGIIHIADSITNCITSIIKNYSQESNAIRLGKVIKILQKKGDYDLAERLDILLPDIISCKEINVNNYVEYIENKFKISALRVYNIVKLLKKKYLEGMLNRTDFEYSKMLELEILLKNGFLLPKPISLQEYPCDVENWWDFFEKG